MLKLRSQKGDSSLCNGVTDIMTEIGETTGNIHETFRKVHVEWKIPASLALSGTPFKSPVFYLSDSCWGLVVNPKGRKENLDCVGLFLDRKDNGSQKIVEMSAGIKKADGVEEKRASRKLKMPYETNRKVMVGMSKFIKNADLTQRESLLMPRQVLTITCTLTSVDSYSTDVSLYNRLWNLSQNLRTILEEKKGADFNLKVGDCDFSAHRMILEGRCDYFVGMLCNGFQENGKGAAEIDGIEEDVFHCILTYLYTGEVEEMSSENVIEIYRAADRLLLLELKKSCVDYMTENLSHELICGAVVIAEKYQELKLEKLAMRYLARHADEIFESEAWENLKKDYKDMVPKILEKIIIQSMKLVKM